MATLLVILSYWWILTIPIGLYILTKFWVNVAADEIATIETRYLGKEMKDGRTVAIAGEVGIQAKIRAHGANMMICACSTLL